MSTPPRLPDQFTSLQNQIDRLSRELDGYKEEEAERLAAEERADQIEQKKEARRENRQAQAAAALDQARADAIRAIARLLPQAVKQARAGKPALLRMILRATR